MYVHTYICAEHINHNNNTHKYGITNIIIRNKYFIEKERQFK